MAAHPHPAGAGVMRTRRDVVHPSPVIFWRAHYVRPSPSKVFSSIKPSLLFGGFNYKCRRH